MYERLRGVSTASRDLRQEQASLTHQQFILVQQAQNAIQEAFRREVTFRRQELKILNWLREQNSKE